MTLDGVARQIADTGTEIEDLERQVEAAQEALFSAKQRLDAIDGGTAAAEAQQATQSVAARIAKEARTYARARLASAMLNRVVQLYREQHQGPLLERAAEVFARITLGSFSGLTIDYEDDRQVLLGIRPDAARVLSPDGARDARPTIPLAEAGRNRTAHRGAGPFPVIVDDLLVQFDDDRALATLEVLSELSAKTQVLFFHAPQALVELAEHRSLRRQSQCSAVTGLTSTRQSWGDCARRSGWHLDPLQRCESHSTVCRRMTRGARRCD